MNSQTIAPEMPQNFEEQHERAKQIERNIKRIVFLQKTALQIFNREHTDLPDNVEFIQLELNDIYIEKNLDDTYRKIMKKLDDEIVAFKNLSDSFQKLLGRN